MQYKTSTFRNKKKLMEMFQIWNITVLLLQFKRQTLLYVGPKTTWYRGQT